MATTSHVSRRAFLTAAGAALATTTAAAASLVRGYLVSSMLI
jgi:hypothetical protein